MILARCLAALAGILVGCCAAQAQDVSADEVKAAFLFHFVSYVDWPKPDAKRPVVVGVAGAHAVESELRRVVRARSAAGRPLLITHVDPDAAPQDLDLLFIGSEAASRMPALIGAVKGRPVLIVTEAAGALEQGSMINFVTTDRVRFEIALDSAIDAGLRLSARLLSVALRVKQGDADHGLPPMLAGARQPFSGASIAALVPRPPSRASLNRFTTPSSASASEG